VRTTVRLDDELYRQVKMNAARTGRTIADVIEDALRTSLTKSDPEVSRPLPALPTFGQRGPLPGVDLTSNAAALDSMDEEVPAVARR
jgi:hypothetical protein